MAERPFHHGNLRTVLLDEATAVLRESGVDGLSLRDLARRAGVSHGAPRSHFVDRQALLDALAEAGFQRLTADVRAALGEPGDDVRARFLRVAGAYVDFAIDDAALMDLMFQAKAQAGGGPPRVAEAAAELFTVLDSAMGPDRTTPMRVPEMPSGCCSRPPCRGSRRWCPRGASPAATATAWSARRWR